MFQLFLQIFYANLVLSCACAGYVLVQFVEGNRFLVGLTHKIYVVSQGVPAVIYLTKNRTLRRHIRSRAGGKVSDTKRTTAPNANLPTSELEVV